MDEEKKQRLQRPATVEDLCRWRWKDRGLVGKPIIDCTRVKRLCVDDECVTRLLSALNDRRAIIRHDLPEDVRIVNVQRRDDYWGWWVYLHSMEWGAIEENAFVIPETECHITIEPIA